MMILIKYYQFSFLSSLFFADECPQLELERAKQGGAVVSLRADESPTTFSLVDGRLCVEFCR